MIIVDKESYDRELNHLLSTDTWVVDVETNGLNSFGMNQICFSMFRSLCMQGSAMQRARSVCRCIRRARVPHGSSRGARVRAQLTHAHSPSTNSPAAPAAVRASAQHTSQSAWARERSRCNAHAACAKAAEACVCGRSVCVCILQRCVLMCAAEM